MDELRADADHRERNELPTFHALGERGYGWWCSPLFRNFVQKMKYRLPFIARAGRKTNRATSSGRVTVRTTSRVHNRLYVGGRRLC